MDNDLQKMFIEDAPQDVDNLTGVNNLSTLVIELQKQLDEIDNRMKNLLLTLSYPNLKAKAVDLNKALENGGSMLAIALNPDTLKQISNN